MVNIFNPINQTDSSEQAVFESHIAKIHKAVTNDFDACLYWS